MPRSWSDAIKACKRHPRGANGRACRCRVGWRYRISLPDPITGLGATPTWSTSFPTKEAADDDQRRVRQEIAEGTFTSDRGKTVAIHLDEWLDRKRAAGRKASTIAGYESVVTARIAPAIGHHRLGRLTQHHVQAWLDAVAREPQLGAGRTGTVTTGTLVNIRAVLRAALNDALRRGLVSRNVAELVELPEVKRPVPTAVEADRLRTWLAWCEVNDGPMFALWLAVSVYGPRRGELLGLRWADTDTTKQLITIRQELVDVRGDHECRACGSVHRRLLFDEPKSAAGERTWPLVPEVEAAFMAHRLRQDDERASYGDDYADHDLVFAQPNGNPWRPDWVSREFRRTFLASGAAEGMAVVPSIKVLRSTSVTALHEAGLSLEVIQRVTGHSVGTDVTKDHYLAVSAERARSEYGAIASRLRSDHLYDHRPETTGGRDA